MRSLLHPFIAAGLALLALPCFAITKAPPALKHVSGNVWEAVHDAGNTVSSTRTWAKGTEVGSAKATDVFTWVYRERSKIPITATTTVGASVVGRIAAKSLPIVGTASLVYDVWTELGCKFEGGQVKCDMGTEPTGVDSSAVTWWYNGNGYPSSTPEGACSASASGQSPGCQSTSLFWSSTTAVCRITCTSGYTAEVVVQPKCSAGLVLYNSGSEWSCRLPDGSEPSGTACPPGSTLSPVTGRCSTGNYTPQGADDAADHWDEHAPKVPGYADKVPGIVDEAVGAGVPVPSSPPQLSGPPSVTSPGPTTTTTTPGGTPATTTTTNTVNLTYNGSQVIINQTNTTTNPDGSTTETTDESFPEWLCGVLGMPDCNVKVNETGTPEWEQPDNSALDEIKAADAAKMNDVAQTIPEPDLGWFDAPPLAACRPYPLPNDMGEIDACDVVDSVRSVMAYLWALVAAWMAFGWIRQAVNGG